MNQIIECPVADCANGFIDDVGTHCPTCNGTGHVTSQITELLNVQEKRKFIAFCPSCGATDYVHVNPEILEAKYATESCGWYFIVRKVATVRDNGTAPAFGYELSGQVESDAELIIDDTGEFRAQPPASNWQYWSRTICLKFMKYGQAASTCPCCGLGIELLLHDDDFVTTANGGRIHVREGKF